MRYILVLLMLLFVLPGQAQKVDLLYFTDAHRIFPVDDVDGGRGGVARLKTIADLTREENPNTLLIHGGDLCGGVLFGGMYKGFPMIEAFNEIPVDICNFGQHEFDFGVAHTLELLSKSKSEWFSSNLKNRDGDVFANLPEYLIKRIGGLKIGFIGLTDAMNTSAKTEEVIQDDLYVSISEVLDKIGQVDFLVVITQTGLEKNRKILEQFPDVDLILTEEQYEYETNVFYKGSKPIVATAGNMSSLAKISLSRGKAPLVQVIPLDRKVESEKYLRDMEVYYKNDMELQLSEKLTYLKVPLTFRDGIIQESLAGNLVTDAFRQWHNSDVGLIDGSGIRSDVPAGNFSLKSARSILPFGNKICQIVIKGNELKQILKVYAKSKRGNLLHVSGIQYKYSVSKDEIEVIWRNKELHDEDLLTVSLNNYLLEKLDGDFEVLINQHHPEAVEDYEVLRQYCKKYKILNPKLEGRFTIIGE